MTLGRSTLAGALTILAILGALFAGSLLLSSVDRGVYRMRAAEALNGHVLVERAFFPFAAATAPYKYHHNDCMILSMLTVEPAASAIQSALSPRYPDLPPPPNWQSNGVDDWRQASRQRDLASKAPRHVQCYSFIAALEGAQAPKVYYHRYIHGYWVLAGFLLLFMSFKTATTLVFALALAPSLILICLVARRKLQGQTIGSRDWAYLVAAVTYLLVSGVGLYGWSLSFGPGEFTLSTFLLFAYLRPLGTLSDGALVLAAVVFGCFTAVFEFLTGGIPSGLALLFGLMGIDRQGDNGLRRGTLAIGAFCVAVAAVFALKAGAVALVWGGGEVAAAGAKLQEWTSPAAWGLNEAAATRLEALGIPVAYLASSRVAAMGFALAKMAYFSDLLTGGARPLGLFVCVGGPALLVVLALRDLLRRNAASLRAPALLLLGAVGSVLAWYLLLVGHTIQHAYFMQRPLAWLFIILMGLLAWRVSERLGRNRVEWRSE